MSLYGGRDAYENIQNSKKTIFYREFYSRGEWMVGRGYPNKPDYGGYYAAISSKAECPPLGLWANTRNKLPVFCKSSGVDQEMGLIFE